MIDSGVDALVHVSFTQIFSLSGFEVVKERPLSRWRNLAHPVSRRLFVIKAVSHAKTQRPDSNLDFAPVRLGEPIYSGSGNTSARSPY